MLYTAKSIAPIKFMTVRLIFPLPFEVCSSGVLITRSVKTTTDFGRSWNGWSNEDDVEIMFLKEIAERY